MNLDFCLTSAVAASILVYVGCVVIISHNSITTVVIRRENIGKHRQYFPWEHYFITITEGKKQNTLSTEHQVYTSKYSNDGFFYCVILRIVL